MKENISVLVLAESEMGALCGISVSPNIKNTQALILSGFTYGIFDKLPNFFKKMAISLNYINLQPFPSDREKGSNDISKISQILENHFDIIIASGEENISMIADFICNINKESEQLEADKESDNSESGNNSGNKSGDKNEDNRVDTKLICLSKHGRALEVCDLMLVQSNFANTKLCDNIAYFGELIGKNVSYMLPYKQQIFDTISSLESPRIGLFVGANDPFFKPDKIVAFTKAIIKLVKQESGSLIVSINKNIDEKIAEIFRSTIDGEIDFYIKKDCDSYEEAELQDVSLFKSVDKVIASSLSLDEMSIISCFHKTIHIPESKQKNKALLEAMGFHFLDMGEKININGGRETKINDIEAIQTRILKTVTKKTPAKMEVYHQLNQLTQEPQAEKANNVPRNIIANRKASS